MPPQIALLLCTICVIGALVLDCRRTQNVSHAIWISLIWLAVIASRPLGTWFHQSTDFVQVNVAELADGSALDRNVLSVLMLLAIVVLIRRKLLWKRWARQNAWIVALFLFAGASVLWSDFPAIALRRWFRAVGSLLMILVVVSEEDPVAAIATLIRRCAFVLVPMSIVLIKYYRIGVGYSYWTGQEFLVGVTTDKNALGRLCLVSGIFALWELLNAKKDSRIQMDTMNRFLGVIIFITTLWLLRASHSATSLASFLLAACMLILLGIPKVRGLAKHFGTLLIFGGPVVVALVLWLNLPEVFVHSLGRNMTFTDRTFIWNALLHWNINPMVGTGYASFWLGDRARYFAETYQGISEAHNGYIGMYIQLGFAGLFLLAGLLISMFRKARYTLQTDVTYGKLRMTILAVFLLYNVTEAGINATTLIFFVLLLVGIEIPETVRVSKPSPIPIAHSRLPRRRQIEATSRPRK